MVTGLVRKLLDFDNHAIFQVFLPMEHASGSSVLLQPLLRAHLHLLRLQNYRLALHLGRDRDLSQYY
jgi:hypothetical protein